MAKQTITITVDSDIIEQIRQLRLNISGEINEYLKGLLARYNEDIEGINVKLEQIQLEKAQKRAKHWQNIIKSTQTRIEKWEEMKKDKEKTKLEREKEVLETGKRCIYCNELKGDLVKMHNFEGKQVCNGCFMNADASLIKKWMNK